jgi:hypothetical protein
MRHEIEPHGFSWPIGSGLVGAHKPRFALGVLTALFLGGIASAGAPPATAPHRKEYWLDRIARVHPGMQRSQVEKLLPVHSSEQEKPISHGHASFYAVDSEWSVEVPYDFNGFVEDERKNPYGVMHLYKNRVIGPAKLIHTHTEINWTLYPH